MSSSSIFIGRIPYSCREKDLEYDFGKYGKIRDINYNKNRGFAFIEYHHSDEA